mmetsp:Transcript_7256/g.15859  ORF Transcript_7256/g.15859 Transcript_7256/m.15859 type:complete len:206 (-) Transcript_7256:19-636(-)
MSSDVFAGKDFSSFSSHSENSPPANQPSISLSFSGFVPMPPCMRILPHFSLTSRTFSTTQSILARSSSVQPMRLQVEATYLSMALDCPTSSPSIDSSGTRSMLAAKVPAVFCSVYSSVSNPPPSFCVIGYRKSSNSRPPILNNTREISAAPFASKYISLYATGFPAIFTFVDPATSPAKTRAAKLAQRSMMVDMDPLHRHHCRWK